VDVFGNIGHVCRFGQWTFCGCNFEEHGVIGVLVGFCGSSGGVFLSEGVWDS